MNLALSPSTLRHKRPHFDRAPCDQDIWRSPSLGIKRLSQACAHAVHEARNPLSSLRLQIQLLQHQLEKRRDPGHLSRQSSDPVSELIQDMQIEIDRACLHLDDLAALSQLNDRSLRIYPRRFDLLEVLRSLALRHQRLFELKGTELQTRFPIKPLQMWSDPNRIEQIVNNLLSNAWKYGASKPVTLKVRVQKRTKNGTDCVQISVIDQGPGISEQEQPRIFEGYFRTREQSSQIGTGLGLTISRKISHLLNGTIELTSRPNEGCRFTVTLPVTLPVTLS